MNGGMWPYTHLSRGTGLKIARFQKGGNRNPDGNSLCVWTDGRFGARLRGGWWHVCFPPLLLCALTLGWKDLQVH